jgi:ATP-dependent Clp protease ATP-binding subunit ClpA
VVKLLATTGFDPASGARSLERVIERLVAGPLGQYMLQASVGEGCSIQIREEGGRLVFSPATVTDRLETR